MFHASLTVHPDLTAKVKTSIESSPDDFVSLTTTAQHGSLTLLVPVHADGAEKWLRELSEAADTLADEIDVRERLAKVRAS